MKADESGNKRVAGAVTNWTLVSLNHDTQMCMDPNVIESKVMVSSTGHDGPMGASGTGLYYLVHHATFCYWCLALMLETERENVLLSCITSGPARPCRGVRVCSGPA